MLSVQPELHQDAQYVTLHVTDATVELLKYNGLIVIAKDQPEYNPLPASVDGNGCVMTEWELTAEELHQLFTGGRIRLWIHTFNTPLQPLSIEVVGGEKTNV